MSLPENTTYQGSFQPFLQGITGAMKKLSSTLPNKKSVNTSGFGNVVGAVKSGVQNAKAKLGPVTTPYGGSTRYEKFHPGIDIAGAIGTPVSAYATGRVTKIVTGMRQGSPGFGNYVVVTDPKGNQHRYSHLQNAYVNMGQQVNPGQNIGTMGNTGQTYSLHGGTGSHLDYRIVDLYGKYINPNRYIM